MPPSHRLWLAHVRCTAKVQAGQVLPQVTALPCLQLLPLQAAGKDDRGAAVTAHQAGRELGGRSGVGEWVGARAGPAWGADMAANDTRKASCAGLINRACTCRPHLALLRGLAP